MPHTKTILDDLPKTKAFKEKLSSFNWQSEDQKNQAYKCLSIMQDAERKQEEDNKKEL